ncbi:hypothetical protein POM88_053075 [Heracleum sosnowskyi]|uniref:Uncharacterized protein n=1 Tax=Heracleum sosnowskyi TaxID=360622 RepID=A0AAD8GQI6_9APIA|nr:hypothetical protein POM88_053075 [Heracleum sosnowskyi]
MRSPWFQASQRSPEQASQRSPEQTSQRSPEKTSQRSQQGTLEPTQHNTPVNTPSIHLRLSKTRLMNPPLPTMTFGKLEQCTLMGVYALKLSKECWNPRINAQTGSPIYCTKDLNLRGSLGKKCPKRPKSSILRSLRNGFWIEDWKTLECRAKYERKKQNRRGGVDQGSYPPTHTGGSASSRTVAARLAGEWERDPSALDLFEYLHTKKHDRVTYIDEKSAKIAVLLLKNCIALLNRCYTNGVKV